MTQDRARKQTARIRQVATGEPYVLARRLVGAAGGSASSGQGRGPHLSGVFQSGPRTDRRPSDGTESIFQFLDRVDQPFYAKVRQLIEDWFAHYPEPDRASLAARLRGDDVNHRSAFWELWLHEFLVRCGFTVTVEPDCPDGRRRDFLVDAETGSFYLEAHCFFDAAEQRGAERRLAEFRKGLESRLELPRHTVTMWVRQIGPKSHPAQPLAHRIQEAAGTVRSGEMREVAQLVEAGWSVGIFVRGIDDGRPALPVTEIAVGRSDVSPVETLHIAPLRAALATKAKEASRLDLPYVVAINFCHRTQYLLRPIDIHQALVGTETMILGPDLDDVAMQANRDGSWVGGPIPRTTSVSALLVIKDMAPDWAAAQLPTLYLHPFAERPLAVPLPLPIAVHENDPAMEPKIVRPSTRAHELFNLPEDWPGSEPFSQPYL